MRITRKLAGPDYPATAVVDAWISRFPKRDGFWQGNFGSWAEVGVRRTDRG
ncbi:MAG: hypothetical protein IPK50_14425 [Fibrobacterota bacterium]|nr:hypothetical protein [Fibrobacterota bacterium]QQS03492.1 MAG: hypothetical protein IPK50_14425 [Fibrobacterota bacterium]